MRRPRYRYTLNVPAAYDLVETGDVTLPKMLAGQAGIDGYLNGSVLCLSFEDRSDLLGVRPCAPVYRAAPAPPKAGPTFGGTKPRLIVYSRNDVSWLSVRSWSAASKKADMAALKAAKRDCSPDIINLASDEMATTLKRFYRTANPVVCVTCVPCGHSRRSDCFGYRFASATATKLGFTFRKMFDDRFVTGSSHPKEFAKLPSLKWIEQPSEPVVLLIDDVATSGWHMEEGLSELRSKGSMAFGASWISGTVQ